MCKALHDLTSPIYCFSDFIYSSLLLLYYRHTDLLAVLELFRPMTEIFALAVLSFRSAFPTDICMVSSLAFFRCSNGTFSVNCLFSVSTISASSFLFSVLQGLKDWRLDFSVIWLLLYNKLPRNLVT